MILFFDTSSYEYEMDADEDENAVVGGCSDDLEGDYKDFCGVFIFRWFGLFVRFVKSGLFILGG